MASLASHGSVRLVQRRHCFYKVDQRRQQAIVWCRPVSPEARFWMEQRGLVAQRIVCELAEVDVWIGRQEHAISDGIISATQHNNIVPAPGRRTTEL